MNSHDKLRNKLQLITSNVYFQPPQSLKLNYPCIIFTRNAGDTLFADNKPYMFTNRYTVTVIDKDPNSDLPDKVAKLPMSTFDRFYVSDNLNHYVFNIYNY